MRGSENANSVSYRSQNLVFLFVYIHLPTSSLHCREFIWRKIKSIYQKRSYIYIYIQWMYRFYYFPKVQLILNSQVDQLRRRNSQELHLQHMYVNKADINNYLSPPVNTISSLCQKRSGLKFRHFLRFILAKTGYRLGFLRERTHLPLWEHGPPQVLAQRRH